MKFKHSFLLLFVIFLLVVALIIIFKKDKGIKIGSELASIVSLNNNNTSKRYDSIINRPTKLDNHESITIDLSGKNQVLVHKYVTEKLHDIANKDYGLKTIGSCKQYIYTFHTISKQLKKEVHMLLDPIVCSLNKQTNLQFKIDRIDYVTKKIDKLNGKIMYLIECFLHDKLNSVSKKIETEILYNLNTSTSHINYIENSTNKFLRNQVDRPRQPNIDFINGIDTNLKLHTEKKTSLYKNEAVQDILTGVETKRGKILDPANNHDSYVEPAEIRNKTIEPTFIQKLHASGINGWPNKQVKSEWDKKGILSFNGKKEKCLENYNTSYQKRPIDYQLQPGFATL